MTDFQPVNQPQCASVLSEERKSLPRDGRMVAQSQQGGDPGSLAGRDNLCVDYMCLHVLPLRGQTVNCMLAA